MQHETETQTYIHRRQKQKHVRYFALSQELILWLKVRQKHRSFKDFFPGAIYPDRTLTGEVAMGTPPALTPAFLIS